MCPEVQLKPTISKRTSIKFNEVSINEILQKKNLHVHVPGALVPWFDCRSRGPWFESCTSLTRISLCTRFDEAPRLH